MGSFELVTVWRSDNCPQICIKFDPVTLVIDQPTESILHTKYPWFCFSGNWRHLERCQQCQGPVSAQLVSGAGQWSPGQGKVTTLCLFVLINYTPELLQQSAKSGKLGKNMSWSRVSVLSLSWVGISEPGKQRQTANVANWVENCDIYTKYCQNRQIKAPGWRLFE